jgi:hypothetical protein
VHALLILALGLWLLPLISSGDLLSTLSFTMGESSEDLDLHPLNMSGAALDGSSASGQRASGADGSDSPSERDPNERLEFGGQIALQPLDRAPNTGMELPDALAAEGTEAFKVTGRIQRTPSTTAEVREVEDVAGAVARYTGAIRGEMEQGDTLVLWLLDQSLSLHGDRQKIAFELEPFFKSIRGFNELRSQSGREFLLRHAIVAYGRNSFQRLEPTPLGWKVIKEVKELPVDPSGLENVMTAIQRSLYYYRGAEKHRERIIIMVWTDESGDDTQLLEPTISLCRAAGAAVHIVGPSAVVGSDRGSHLWHQPGTGHGYYLPVTRGPESSFPERALLAYWYTGPRFWAQDGAAVAKNVTSYGGPYRERVLSGFGSYALTRLALETGGTFTIYDRPADRPQYRLEDVREHMPDYGSRQEYLASLQDRPLRLALHEAAMFTHQQFGKLDQPQFTFYGGRASVYPFDSTGGIYFAPPVFRSRLKKSLEDEAAQATQMQAIARKALSFFEKKDEDLEYEYRQEPSKRWRAWYDLNRGRLLATSVRAREYAQLCRLILRYPEKVLGINTNHLAFRFRETLRISGCEADAAEAKRLLKRCVDANPKTPWADFALWELEVPMGLDLTVEVIPPPPPPPPRISGGGFVAPSRPLVFPKL